MAVDVVPHAPRSASAARLTRALRERGAWDGVRVLAYRRGGRADVAALDAQLAVLARETDVIGADELLDVRGRGAGRRVLLTFDGGYRDAYDQALPLLRAHGLTATFFVSSSLVDRPRVAWWDELAWMASATALPLATVEGWLDGPLRFDDAARRAASAWALTDAYVRLPTVRTPEFLHAVADALDTGRCPPALAADLWLTWPMVRELRDAGMGIGAHGASHAVLARATPARQRQEIGACAARLRVELGEAVHCFSYPIGQRGSFDQVTRDAVRAAGFRLAFSAYGGRSSYARWDPLDVRRSVLGWGGGG